METIRRKGSIVQTWATFYHKSNNNFYRLRTPGHFLDCFQILLLASSFKITKKGKQLLVLLLLILFFVISWKATISFATSFSNTKCRVIICWLDYQIPIFHFLFLKNCSIIFKSQLDGRQLKDPEKILFVLISMQSQNNAVW